MTVGRDKYARLAARLLGEQRSDDVSAHPDTRRDAVVAAMALAIAGKARRRRISARVAVALAVAASATLAVRVAANRGASLSRLVVEHVVGKETVLVRAGSTGSLADLSTLTAGDGVRSGRDSGASLAFKNGTRVVLASASDFRVDELGSTRRFSLLAGHLEAHVMKLLQNERFIVNTPDCEIEVRGTVFTIDVDTSRCGDSAAASSVRVNEGEVSVRSRDNRVLVHSGETWAVPCAAPEVRTTLPSETVAARGRSPTIPSSRVQIRAHAEPAGELRPRLARAMPAQRSTKIEAPVPPSVPPVLSPPRVESPSVSVSRLGQENDLMSAAMAAEQRGQVDEALRSLNDLIQRFPDGPLNESARIERQRLLAAPNRP